MYTRILSAFNLLKRVGFAILVFGRVALAQDWETPILLTNDSTFWDNYPVLRVDASHNVHVFAVKQSDSLRESDHTIVPHELCYMKFTNWGVPIGERVVVYDPEYVYETVLSPAVVLDRNSRFHVFWRVLNGDWHPEIYYAMLDTNGNVLVGPDTLYNPANIIPIEGPAYAVQNLDGTVWFVMSEAYGCVSEDGVPCDSVRRLHETSFIYWPTLAIGPDTSAWACFRWGPDAVVAMRRLDDPQSESVYISQGLDQHGLFIDRFGYKHILTASDSARVHRISPDWSTRDSVVYADIDEAITKGSPLIEASGDSLLHSYRTYPGGAEVLVWFSLDNRILRGPEYYHTAIRFASSPTGVATSSSGGYWLLGHAPFENAQFLQHLAMLHVSGDGEPLSIESEPNFANSSQSQGRVLTYPSPTSGHVIFNIPNDIGKIGDIRLYNVLGQQVEQIDVPAWPWNILTYDLDGNLPTGIYFATFRTVTQVYTVKIVKQ